MKLAFYMTGNHARILRRCAHFLPEIDLIAICPNWQSSEETNREPRFSSVEYIYDGFNKTFDQINVDEFCARYSTINLYEVLQVDKTHYKKKTGAYQLRYLCAIGERLSHFFEKNRPNYILFPIIETIDAMLAYRMAPIFGIRPIVYCHARFTNLSFFSNSHYELLPEYAKECTSSPEDRIWAEAFIDRYREVPGPFNYRPEPPVGEIYSDTKVADKALHRLLRNVRLKLGVERHNKMISFWISFQVYFQRFFLTIRNWTFINIEKYIIKPRPLPEDNYDFFPLHFSPESSINVPAPYYIDQTRVVDRILLDRKVNRVLVLKEHPAMFGFRDRGFYRTLKYKPFVQFVHRDTPSYELIRQAKTVYSVTGTACLEAFFFGVDWVQYGENFLSDWVRRHSHMDPSTLPTEFICAVRAISSDFVLYSPGRSSNHDEILFSKSNVEKLCKHLEFHIHKDILYQEKHRSMSE